MRSFKKNAAGQYLCKLIGGPLPGEHVLLIDRPQGPFGHTLITKPGDILAYIPIAGHNLACGLARYNKTPTELVQGDSLSLPWPDTTPTIDRAASGKGTITIQYASYVFEGVMETTPDGLDVPIFLFVGKVPVTTPKP